MKILINMLNNMTATKAREATPKYCHINKRHTPIWKGADHNIFKKGTISTKVCVLTCIRFTISPLEESSRLFGDRRKACYNFISKFINSKKMRLFLVSDKIIVNFLNYN